MNCFPFETKFLLYEGSISSLHFTPKFRVFLTRYILLLSFIYLNIFFTKVALAYCEWKLLVMMFLYRWWCLEVSISRNVFDINLIKFCYYLLHNGQVFIRNHIHNFIFPFSLGYHHGNPISIPWLLPPSPWPRRVLWYKLRIMVGC